MLRLISVTAVSPVLVFILSYGFLLPCTSLFSSVQGFFCSPFSACAVNMTRGCVRRSLPVSASVGGTYFPGGSCAVPSPFIAQERMERYRCRVTGRLSFPLALVRVLFPLNAARSGIFPRHVVQ